MRKDTIGEPPASLAANEVIVKVIQNRGSTFDAEIPASQLAKASEILGSASPKILVGLSPSLKNKFFIKRNGFVVASLEKLSDHAKISGEITNVVGDPRQWQKALPEWPEEFRSTQVSETMDLPPSEDEYETEEEEEEDEEEEPEPAVVFPARS